MRVLFTTTGHSGHLLPLAPLARANERAGHEVAVAAQASRVAAVEGAGLAAFALDEAPDAAWEPLMRQLAEARQPEADRLAIADGFARIHGRAALPGAVRLLEAWRPDVVVHEGYEVAGPLAAERLGIPTVRVALGLASTERWLSRLARPAVDELRGTLGPPRDHGGARRRRTPLVSAVPLGLDDGPAHRFRTPRPDAAPPLPDWWERPADPLVYLTFGSVSGSLPIFPELFRRALDAVAPLPVRVLLTVGRGADLSALGPLPANVHAEPWLAQEDVLPHAAAVVGHGGYGTTLGALAHGVPLVLLPLFAGDQWRNARRVAQLGAGLMLEDGERLAIALPGPTVMAALPAAVERVLAEPRFRRTARRIAADIAALPPVDDAVALIERAVRGRAAAPAGALARRARARPSADAARGWAA